MINNLSVQQCKKMLDDNEAVLVDVREPDEYIAEHIEGAELIPLSVFAQNYTKIESGDKKIIFQCRSGGRSGKVCEAMANVLGAENIYNMAGGIEEWKAVGFLIKKS